MIDNLHLSEKVITSSSGWMLMQIEWKSGKRVIFKYVSMPVMSHQNKVLVDIFK